MGSIVAYDTLRADGTLPVAALLTIGSPLAMPSFYRRIEATAPAGLPPANRTPVPGQLAMWVNVWTRDDPATAGHVQMASRYRPLPPSTVEVQDVETWGRVASPTGLTEAHDALDYLSSQGPGDGARYGAGGRARLRRGHRRKPHLPQVREQGLHQCGARYSAPEPPVPILVPIVRWTIFT